MLNRTLAWHQLGVNVSSAKTSEEALSMSGLNWEVKSNPIFDANGCIIEGFKANTRTSDNEVLGIVGTRYNIVQNKEAFDFTDALIGNGVTYEKAGMFHRGKAVWLLAKMPQKKILDDDIDPYLVFINSHDGCGSIKVAMLPIRIACSNALNAALREADRVWSAIHSGSISTKMLEAQRTLGLAASYMDALTLEAEALANKAYNDVEFEKIIDTLYPITPQDSARRVENVINIKNGLFDALSAPDISQYKDTKYGKWMAVTDYFDHADPVRLTSTFQESRWQNIATGHNMVDAFYKELVA